MKLQGKITMLINQDYTTIQIEDPNAATTFFGSQNSFFKRDGKQYARCTIRRWV